MYTFTIASRLAAPAHVVWQHSTTMSGVNREFFPLLRMTCPQAYLERSLGDAPIGERVFRSWILLFGVVPIDYDDLCFQRIVQGEGFAERSTMLTQRAWHHDRWIRPDGDGCVLTDTIAFVPRVPGAGVLMRPVFHLVFRLRHHNLRRAFGGIAGPE